jgi:hypothetical protein
MLQPQAIKLPFHVISWCLVVCRRKIQSLATLLSDHREISAQKI